MAFATFEDYSGQGEVVCFAQQLDRCGSYLAVDEIVLVKGETEVRGGSVKIVANDIIPMWKVREQMVQSIVVRVNIEDMNVEAIDRFRELCETNRGKCKLYFDVIDPGFTGNVPRIRSRKFVVEPTDELMRGVVKLFGSSNVIVEGDA